ncbi:MAG: hypothetical protein ACD_64C00170G0001 [uncultured bacterium]|nr:MAG: hypothetical protein ACD_64C00170G0001 [uncultured bacterium]HLE76581.1 hypothetical protein [Candidatus Babeliales bacterium]
MNIVQSWKDSLNLFKPENLKPFLMVTAKTVIDIYKNINKPLTSQGNWILFGIVAGLVVLTNIVKLFHWFWLVELLLATMYYLLTFVVVLALRPSIDQKGWDYFYDKVQKFWYLIAPMIILAIGGIDTVGLFVWYLFFLFAAIDTHGTAQELLGSLRTSFIMIVYNLPVCIAAYVALWFINKLLDGLLSFVIGYFGGLTLAVLFYILLIPIQVALIANLYVKFIHGQPSLYFKQPE